MIYLGADHGGFELKEKIKAYLSSHKIAFKDLGPHTLDSNDDYPTYAFKVAQAVVENTSSREKGEPIWNSNQVGNESKHDDQSFRNSSRKSDSWKDENKGILLCRSAVGVTIAANKIPEIRAAAIYDTKAAAHARTNDNVNVLCLSGDWTSEEKALEIIKIWLETDFSKEPRHQRRLNMILDKEGAQCCGGCSSPGGASEFRRDSRCCKEE